MEPLDLSKLEGITIYDLLHSIRGPPLNPSSDCVRIDGVPVINDAQELVACLEAALGRGTVLHCKLQTDRSTGLLREPAIVQFKSEESAVECCRLNRTLLFRGQRLVVNRARDIGTSKKKQGTVSKIKDATLRMGCLLRPDHMYVLHTCSPVKIEADNPSRRLRVFLADGRKSYKLEWSYRTFIDLSKRRVNGCLHVLLKVWTAPHAYVLDHGGGADYFCEQVFDFLSDLNAPVWVRTTDFTEGASIGQSFVYCMELPRNQSKALDSLMRDYLGSPLEEKHLTQTLGCSYSASELIAPIIKSPGANQLPFEVIFAVNSLVQHGYLSAPCLDEHFYDMLDSEMPPQQTMLLLSKLKRNMDTCYDPKSVLRSQVASVRRRWNVQIRPASSAWLDDGLVMVRRVYISPSRAYFVGPEVDVSNRVTRHYGHCIDNFLRVSFVEEDFSGISSSALTHPNRNEHTRVYERIISILRNGITIGDKRFRFLAFSTSQLQESSVWMFASDAITSPEKIRMWMGDFLNIRNVAKCAARMGQSFSSSTKSLDVYPSEVERIPDIWNTSGVYCFSDGIGKISLRFATEVARKCKLRGGVPSLFQIRYGGYKGVVAVDPHSSCKLSLRPSMNKFPSTQISLDILNWSHPIPSYVNRQIITLLSTLGVQDSVFEVMQAKVMERLDEMLERGDVAIDVLQTFCAGGESHALMVALLSAGYNPSCEPFLMRMLYAFRAVQLMYLRKKTRIFISQGRLLMGCLDETSTLNYGEVFVSVSPMPGSPHNFFNNGLNSTEVYGLNGVPRCVCIVEGKVMVAKNPCVHPGDVRVLNAVNVPALHHMVDCVVFPQRGPRPHPNECSGSDLDGDLYFVSWDKNLIPPTVDPPMDYQSPEIQELDHPVTVEEIQDHFVKFIMSNSLGVISNAHTVLADMRPSQARDRDCLELARLCSVAVDFPKTGIPAVLPADLRPTTYPDFMEKTDDKVTYESQRVLGKLFRSVVKEGKDRKLSSFTRREAARCYDEELLVEGFEHYLEDAAYLKGEYNERLLELMHDYDIRSEAEIVGGNILNLSKWYQKRPGEVKERIMRAMSSLKKEARSWLKDHFEEDREDDACRAEAFTHEELAKASACYHVTYHPDYVEEHANHEHLLSFPWVVYDKLLAIKRRAQERGRF